jgi:hypothetical protein
MFIVPLEFEDQNFVLDGFIKINDFNSDQMGTDVAANPEGRLFKIGANVGSHGRYIAFQMAEVAVSRHLFADVLRLIAELRPSPNPAPELRESAS